MKTTTFDQLKSILKSMSLSIFPRLRNMEKNIDEIKATIPTPEKEIIFTKGTDGQYTCNIPHAELWEMDADIIGQNACIIDEDKVYGVRGASKKTESLYGNVIQIYADLNVGKYELPSTYHQTLIITYCTPEILGKASAIYSEKVYSLSDSRNDNATPDIPVLDGGGWMNRSIDFMEYDDLHGKYVLKTMSETTKGGAMVGDGLKMVGDALTVDEGEYELIRAITTDQPVEEVMIDTDENGQYFKLSKAIIEVYCSGSNTVYLTLRFNYGNDSVSWAHHVFKDSHRYSLMKSFTDSGYWEMEAYEPNTYYMSKSVTGMSQETVFKNTLKNMPYLSKARVHKNGNYSEELIPEKSIIKLWGVRYNA